MRKRLCVDSTEVYTMNFLFPKSELYGRTARIGYQLIFVIIFGPLDV